jgi:hypothetical protein
MNHLTAAALPPEETNNLATRSETPAIPDPTASQAPAVSMSRVSWHGWPDSIQIQNGIVEAVIVPSIGRVMRLGLAGDAAGAFWANPQMDGQLHPLVADHRVSDQWLNFGGDKCWPAPQSAWPKQQGRYWPPPLAFDSQPMNANIADGSVVLTSCIDPAFGIQVMRHVSLDLDKPVMRIRSEFLKLSGGPVNVAVWTITQMCEPECVSIRLPAQSKFPGGFVRLMGAQPADLKVEAGVLSLVRHRNELVKIGTDGVSMAWVGQTCVVRIDAEQGAGEYPDGGCVTQVYTNPDPLHYVELETIGPLTLMSVGDRIQRTSVYRVSPRSTPDARAEACNAF